MMLMLNIVKNAGSDLNKSGMPSSTKILIVVVIILVAGLGLVMMG